MLYKRNAKDSTHTQSYTTPRSTHIPLPAPGNASNKLLSYLTNCGQLNVAKTGLSASVNVFIADCAKVPRIPPLMMSGDAMLTTWYAKHARLLPSRRVAALKTPPVRSPTSTPVKVLGSPVLPPMAMMKGYVVMASRASKFSETRPYSSPMGRRCHCLAVSYTCGTRSMETTCVVGDPLAASLPLEASRLACDAFEGLERLEIEISNPRMLIGPVSEKAVGESVRGGVDG